MQLIESKRQPLTALLLRTLLVIIHKSLFPCIGSSAQLRPHKQSPSGLTYYLRLLIDLFRCTVRRAILIYYTEQRLLHFKASLARFLASFLKKGKKLEWFLFQIVLFFLSSEADCWGRTLRPVALSRSAQLMWTRSTI